MYGTRVIGRLVGDLVLDTENWDKGLNKVKTDVEKLSDTVKTFSSASKMALQGLVASISVMALGLTAWNPPLLAIQVTIMAVVSAFDALFKLIKKEKELLETAGAVTLLDKRTKAIVEGIKREEDYLARLSIRIRTVVAARGLSGQALEDEILRMKRADPEYRKHSNHLENLKKQKKELTDFGVDFTEEEKEAIQTIIAQNRTLEEHEQILSKLVVTSRLHREEVDNLNDSYSKHLQKLKELAKLPPIEVPSWISVQNKDLDEWFSKTRKTADETKQLENFQKATAITAKKLSKELKWEEFRIWDPETKAEVLKTFDEIGQKSINVGDILASSIGGALETIIPLFKQVGEESIDWGKTLLKLVLNIAATLLSTTGPLGMIGGGLLRGLGGLFQNPMNDMIAMMSGFRSAMGQQTTNREMADFQRYYNMGLQAGGGNRQLEPINVVTIVDSPPGALLRSVAVVPRNELDRIQRKYLNAAVYRQKIR